LSVPPGYDPAVFAAAPQGRDGCLHEVPHPYNGRDLPESTIPGGSDLRYVPPAAFHTPSAVCSSCRLPALFRPVPFLGFSLQSLAPRGQPHAFRRRDPPAVPRNRCPPL
jgi:hypothetical protein